ncbi:hypothetical protein EDB87DRAFT_1646663 [Lactarius vividus]|nr:hypothetical protein EDB87DRAFT_1646663 [Lactarius vividus]
MAPSTLSPLLLMQPRMLSLAVLTALVLLAASDLAVAQIMGPNCTLSLAQSFNSLGQSPCIVAAYMLGTCNNSVFIVDRLQSGNSYRVSANSQFNDCLCTVVTYNLLSVCDACQGESWRGWSNYSSNCLGGPFPLWFPYTVPLGTSVPQWALTDHTSPNDNWNATEAGMADDDILNVYEIVPGYSVNDLTSPLSTPSSEDSPPSESASGPSTAAIAGGVSGGVVALAAIGVLLFYILRKRKRSQALSAAVDGGTPPMSQEHPSLSEDETYVPKRPVARMKLYDPNDPRTFPKYQRVSVFAEDVHDPVAPKDGSPNGNTLTTVQATFTPGYHGLPIV